MHPLLVPILAQTVTLGLLDRTEGRLEFVDRQGQTVAYTGPAATLIADWKHFGVAAGYNPSFQLQPLDKEPRQLLTSHSAALRLTLRQRFKHTTFAVNESGSYTQGDLQQNALAPIPVGAPTNQPMGQTGNTTPGTTGTGTTGTGQTGQNGSQSGQQNQQTQNGTITGQAPKPTLLAYGGTLRLLFLTTSAQVVQELSRRTNIGGIASYNVSTGVDRASHDAYPLVSSETVSAFGTHAITRVDTAGANLTVSHAGTGDGVTGWVATANGTYARRWGPHTSTFFASGISGSYAVTPDGIGIISIYPAFGAGVIQTGKVARGNLAFNASASSAPYLDFLTATVDPRIGLTLSLGWSRDRLRMSVNETGSVSLNNNAEKQTTALNSIYASAQVGYRLGDGFSVDGGVRGAWQTLGSTTLVPPSWALFLGISWGAPITLRKPH